MAAKGSSRGPFVIAAAIVLAALLIVVTLVVLFRDSGDPDSSPSLSPAGRVTDGPKPSRTKTKSPRPRPVSPSPSASPTKSPRPTKSPTPSPAPSPTTNDDDLIRARVQRDASKDRPNEVEHVGNVRIVETDKHTCVSRLGASANVRYDSHPKLGIWFLCKSGDRWVVASGPVYGE